MKFSIIITTTRPHLLEHSLRSAVAQTFDDYEIVVSDNSVAGCRDLVETIGAGKVRYVRPEARMPLTPHWNFAFEQARGDWHLQLCDDDAITPNLLAILDRQIECSPDVESIFWDIGSFCGDPGRSAEGIYNQLNVSRFSGNSHRYDSAELLAAIFNSGTGLFRIKHMVPYFPRAVCHRSVLDAIRARQGQLFHPFCPMTSGAIALLSFSKSTLHLDLPLTLLGSTVDSCGGWIADPMTVDASHAGANVEFAPIKAFRILPTAMAEALLRTQRAMPDRLGNYEVNYVNYFLHCHLFLQSAAERGVDLSAYQKFFDEALAEMPVGTRDAVRAAIVAEPTADTPGLHLRAKRFVGSLLKQLRPPRLPGQVDAGRLGLHNIAECAAYVGTLVEQTTVPNTPTS